MSGPRRGVELGDGARVQRGFNSVSLVGRCSMDRCRAKWRRGCRCQRGYFEIIYINETLGKKQRTVRYQPEGQGSHVPELRLWNFFFHKFWFVLLTYKFVIPEAATRAVH